MESKYTKVRSLFDELSYEAEETPEVKPVRKKKTRKTAATGAEPAPEPARTFLETIMEDPHYLPPTTEDDGFYVNPDDWYYIITCILNRIPLLITGPSGTGKTEIIRLACMKTGIPFRKYDMGGIIDPTEQLMGTHRLEGGSSVFDYARFALDIQEPGVILLDEVNRCPRGTNNILFPLLDASRCLRVEMASGADKREIMMHPECTIIATANIGDEYSGTNEIDAALLTRFVCLQLGYLSPIAERQVLQRRWGIDPESADTIINTANKIRRLYAEKEIQDSDISTRETLKAAEFVSYGYPVLTAVKRVFLPKFQGNDTEGDKSVVRNIIMQD